MEVELSIEVQLSKFIKLSPTQYTFALDCNNDTLQQI